MSLDAAFATAAADLMDQFGAAATYTPPSGVPVATRAAGPERQVRLRAEGIGVEVVHLLRLPAPDVPAPERGGSVQIDAATYLIDALDADDGAVVTVRVRPQ